MKKGLSAITGVLVLMLCFAGKTAFSGAMDSSMEQKESKFPKSFGRHINCTALWQGYGEILSGFRNMYQFHVLYDPDDEAHPFKAWFFGWAVEDCNRHIEGFTGCDAIFAARSKQLERGWEVYAGDGKWDGTMNPHLWRPIFAPQNFYFDEWHNGDPSVVKVKKRFFMAYSSTGHNKDRKPFRHPEDKDGSFLCIMGAVSGDGVHWRRSKGPILVNPNDYGAPTVPQGDSHPYGSYHRPSLLYENGKFTMWFDYWHPRFGVSMGYAENSGDFLNPKDWRILRAGDNPCLPDFPNPDVVKVGDVYFAFADPSGYAPHPWMGRKIVEAVSLNGLDWIVLGYVDPDKDAAATHVPEAFVWREGKTIWLYVFYACQIGGEPYDYRYNRIRVMRRKITDDELILYRALWRKKFVEGGER